MKFITTTLFLLFSIVCFSQGKLTIAKEAAEIFPDEPLVLLESTVHITFEENKQKEMVGIVEHEKKYMALEKGHEFTYALFYDEYSEIEDFDLPRIQDEYYGSDGIFHSDVRVKYSIIELERYADIEEVEATKIYKDLRYMTNFYFTQRQACLNHKIIIEVPNNMKLKVIPFNIENHDITVTEKTNKKGTTYTYTGNNLDKFVSEPSAPGVSYIYPHILIVPESYTVDNKTEKMFDSTEDLYGWYRSLVSQTANESDILKELVAKLTADAKDDKEKVENMYYWVQDNIRYIAFEDGIAGFRPENCQNVYSKRYGDCKGMANLLKQMLIIAGFDARLAWLGTKSIAYDYSVPSLAVDNHMICALQWKDDFIFLDPTEKFINIDHNGERIQGQEVLIEDGEKYIIKKIPVNGHLQNKQVFNLELDLTEQKELTGKVAFTFMGASKVRMSHRVNYTEKQDKDEMIENYFAYGDKNIKISNIEISELDQRNKTSHLKGDILLQEYVDAFGNELYIDLDPYKLYSWFEFKKERKYDYWFSHKKFEEINIKLNIPKGYKIEPLPKPIDIVNDEFAFKGNYALKNDQTIEYHFTMTAPKAMISQTNIEDWNKAVTELKDFYEQPIILKKVGQ